MRVAIIYYTDNLPPERMLAPFRKRLVRAAGGLPIIWVSQQPISVPGPNLVMGPLPKDLQSINYQILQGCEASGADFVFMAEHDVLYPKDYFAWRVSPTRRVAKDVFYNTHSIFCNRQGFYPRVRTPLSQAAAYTQPLICLLKQRLAMIRCGEGHQLDYCEFAYNRFERRMGWTPQFRKNKHPSVDVKHDHNYTPNRLGRRTVFQSEDPYWGKHKDLIKELCL